MLEKLKNIRMPATSEGIVYFLNIIRQYDGISLEDLKILCNHSPNGLLISFEDIIKYCDTFKFIYIDSGVHLNSSIMGFINEFPESINNHIVRQEVDKLFSCELLTPDMFVFDVNIGLYRFRNEKLSLAYTSVRNVLVSQGLFIVKRQLHKSHFYINSEYEKIISTHCTAYKRRMSLRQLQTELEKNVEAGEIAEKFVVKFEKKRLGETSFLKIKRVSEVDVTAGYDIASFDNSNDSEYNRFIEVKAISHNISFFWSSNEYDVARLKGNQYYLYLVYIPDIYTEGYEPIIVQNPASVIMEGEQWLVEPKSYKIRYVNT